MDPVLRLSVTRVAGDERVVADDVVVVEEPLEIRIGEKPVSVTMRTPGHDFELAAGFLFTEGILQRADAIESIRHWGSGNVVRVTLRPEVTIDLQKLARHFYATSSCGVCGKTSIDAVRVQTKPVVSAMRVSRSTLSTLPDILRRGQQMFESTGAIHAAGLFRADGSLTILREDIGRHNAVDKVIGARFLEGRTPIADELLLVSGRAGFEVVQKAVVAGIAIIAAVGAPSSLAVELAREMNVTLAGFVREGRFNVYSVDERMW